MPARGYSDTGYYHVTVRTAGQVALFEGDADRKMLLRFLKNARDESGVRIIAWVLMTDHYHLVLDAGEGPEAVSVFMREANRMSNGDRAITHCPTAPDLPHVPAMSNCPVPITHPPGSMSAVV